MKWEQAKKNLTKDWSRRQKLWYKITYFFESKILAVKIRLAKLRSK
jgi:hypothetical protein